VALRAPRARSGHLRALGQLASGWRAPTIRSRHRGGPEGRRLEPLSPVRISRSRISSAATSLRRIEAELEKHPARAKSSDPYLALAQQHIEQRQLDKARAVLLRLVAAQPNSARLTTARPRGHRLRAVDEAIARLKRAVELDADLDPAWMPWLRLRDPAEAEEALKSTGRPPGQPGQHGLRGAAGRRARAPGRFKERRARSNRSPTPHRATRACGSSSGIYYEQKQYERAASAFRRPSSSSRQSPGALFPRHHAHGRGQGRRAQGELEKILAADPRSVDARVQLAFSTAAPKARGRDQGLQEAVNLEPKRAELFLYLGTAYFRAQQYDRALASLQEGLGIDGKNAI